MSRIWLMRHGEADFSLPRQWNAPGWGADLAPLTARGVAQVGAVVPRVRELRPQILLSSPMTRALQSANLLAQETGIRLTVEFDLHEWVPDLAFQWTSLEEVLALLDEVRACGGEWPAGERRRWEPLSSVRERALRVLSRYSSCDRLLAVCHGQVIRSLTGRDDVECAEIVALGTENGA